MEHTLLNRLSVIQSAEEKEGSKRDPSGHEATTLPLALCRGVDSSRALIRNQVHTVYGVVFCFSLELDVWFLP